MAKWSQRTEEGTVHSYHVGQVKIQSHLGLFYTIERGVKESSNGKWREGVLSKAMTNHSTSFSWKLVWSELRDHTVGQNMIAKLLFAKDKILLANCDENS